jgi:hypothetical protein
MARYIGMNEPDAPDIQLLRQDDNTAIILQNLDTVAPRKAYLVISTESLRQLFINYFAEVDGGSR